MINSMKFKIIVSIIFLLSYAQTSFADTSYKVKPTDSLSVIVNKFYKDSSLSRHQIFVALLAENPHAFRLGNINYLKSKQRLSIPDSDSLLAMEKEDADNLVAEHNRYAKKRKKVQFDPPFKDYMPKNVMNEKTEIGSLAEKQQTASEKLEKLDSETESLRIRLEHLAADKEAMDAEIKQLDSLLKQ